MPSGPPHCTLRIEVVEVGEDDALQKFKDAEDSPELASKIPANASEY